LSARVWALAKRHAVGRPQVSQHGHWMAAVLACDPQVVLSHASAAALWDIRSRAPTPVEVSVPSTAPRRPEGVSVRFKLDFYWPDVGLMVETDGLRYHRTSAQQNRDRLRDQTLTAAGLTILRFSHAQVTHNPDRVLATLAAVARRLRDSPL
jgi:hypothetical protein